MIKCTRKCKEGNFMENIGLKNFLDNNHGYIATKDFCKIRDF